MQMSCISSPIPLTQGCKPQYTDSVPAVDPAQLHSCPPLPPHSLAAGAPQSNMFSASMLAASSSFLSHAKYASTHDSRSKPRACRRWMAASSSAVSSTTMPPPPPMAASMPSSTPSSSSPSPACDSSCRNSCWLLLIICSSCGLDLPSSCSMGTRICGLPCTARRSIWNCGLLRRKSSAPPSPPAAPPPPAPAAAGPPNMLKGCALGP
mmetsp:Transcript_14490/g.36044  ORF Transcript_14490/g.36044 Transcript_14490/m.36044 type:complete len:208 (-) Transcript_14490:358-981(-)